MNQISDDEVPLIGRDPDLMEAFYREHVETIRGFLTRRVADPHLVADLSADIFMAALDGADRYRPQSGPAIAWLYGIARNKVADSLRKQARYLRAEGRVLGRRHLDDDAIAALEERIEAERLTRALYAALADLPARDRRLMELVAVDGLPVTEAAALLGVKPATARVRLHRSKARLRNHLGDQSVLESIDEPLPVLVVQEVHP